MYCAAPVISRLFVYLKVYMRLAHVDDFKLVHIGIFYSYRKVFQRDVFAVDHAYIRHLSVNDKFAAVAVYRQVLLIFKPYTYLIL